MKAVIASLLFLALSGISVPASFAQQDQSYQKLAQEMEALKEHILTLQSQLQTVENTEKMKLLKELADAKTQLVNTEFEKFERNLKESNDKWLFGWTSFFGLIIAVTLAIIGVAFWFSVKSLIANRVENELKGFQKAVAEVDVLKNQTKESISQVYILKNELKESIGQVNILENKIRVLDKAHAADVMGTFNIPFHDKDTHPMDVKELSNESILDVVRDETRHPDIITRAVGILVGRQYSQVVSPVLERLNSTLDSYQDKQLELYITRHLRHLVRLLGYIPTHETHEGLTVFLNRLLGEPIDIKVLLLTETVSTIAGVSDELNQGDWLSPLKTSISQLSNEPEIIKEVLSGLQDEAPSREDFENYLLELLEEHDPEYVNDWRERRAATNTETEETS